MRTRDLFALVPCVLISLGMGVGCGSDDDDSAAAIPKCVVIDQWFDWEGDRPPSVACGPAVRVAPSAAVRQALNLMSTWSVSQIPVVEGDHCVGGLIESSLMTRALANESRARAELLAAELSTRRPLIHHGADDNASGTAAVLAVTDALAKFAQPRRRHVLIALWSAEEIGLVGSNAFVTKPPLGVENISAYLNFDMVGRMVDNKLTVQATDAATNSATKMRPSGPTASPRATRCARSYSARSAP